MALYPSLPKDAPTPNYAKLAENPHSLLPQHPIPPSLRRRAQCALTSSVRSAPRSTCPATTPSAKTAFTSYCAAGRWSARCVGSLWCHDCQSVPKSSCATHRVDNRSPASTVTLGQQLDSTLESWKPTFTRVVETAHGWSVVAIDTTYSTAVTISDMVTPLMTYIIDRLKCFMDS
ncbi:uncharacterized protein LOC122246414 isoform X3 [Penaeus japonicus]|uniref:uncharacterized protein LOC122246414 isoform X3 n=1 Tax=Penaeus japonicus TaxID=27405 RepID=UPI001C7145A8|nr:uncharacterized protein LOC122246414 isoform X3 [Penaeus japonicus]